MVDYDSRTKARNIKKTWGTTTDMKIVKNGKTIKAFRPKFSIQKNIAFSNTNKIVNKLVRAFKNFKPFKF